MIYLLSEDMSVNISARGRSGREALANLCDEAPARAAMHAYHYAPHAHVRVHTATFMFPVGAGTTVASAASPGAVPLKGSGDSDTCRLWVGLLPWPGT